MKLGLEIGSGPYSHALTGMDDLTREPFKWICLDKTDFSESYENTGIAYRRRDTNTLIER